MLHMVWILLPGYIIANGMMIVVLLMDDIPKSEVPIIRQIVHSFNSRACKSQGSSPTRTVASGGKGSSYPLPPGPVELDTSSLWLNAPITKLTSVRRSLLNKEMFLSFIVAFEFLQFPRTALICIFAAGVARSGQVSISCGCKSHRVST